jgi:hypothetical protein
MRKWRIFLGYPLSGIPAAMFQCQQMVLGFIRDTAVTPCGYVR